MGTAAYHGSSCCIMVRGYAAVPFFPSWSPCIESKTTNYQRSNRLTLRLLCSPEPQIQNTACYRPILRSHGGCHCDYANSVYHWDAAGVYILAEIAQEVRGGGKEGILQGKPCYFSSCFFHRPLTIATPLGEDSPSRIRRRSLLFFSHITRVCSSLVNRG